MPSNFTAQHNKQLLSQILWSEIQGWLSWPLWLRVHKGSSYSVAQTCGHLQADPHPSSFMLQLGNLRSLLDVGQGHQSLASSSLQSAAHLAPGFSWNMQGEQKRTWKQKKQSLKPNPGSTIHYFCHILFVKSKSPGPAHCKVGGDSIPTWTPGGSHLRSHNTQWTWFHFLVCTNSTIKQTLDMHKLVQIHAYFFRLDI